jgi:hypothetical protein
MFYKQKLEQHGFKIHYSSNNLALNKEYDFTCPNGHEIYTRLDTVVSRLDRKSKGCKFCRDKDRSEISLNTALKYLPENFKIIDSYRKNVERKENRTIGVYKVRCDQNHDFEVESGHFKNLSCPKCNATLYLGQERTREIFHQIFNVEFKSIRPNWLKNPKTNTNLELDGYNQDLNLAFEFQGKQHTSSNTQFGDEYYAQVERDKLKKEICENLGIKLIEIHQPPKYAEKKFINNVVDQIKKNINPLDYPNINFNENNIHFDNLKFDGLTLNVKKFIDYLQNESPIKGYSCLTTDFHTYEDEITMCCPEGHNYKTTVAEFKRNAENKKGRDIPCITCYEQAGKANTVIDLAYCREEGKKHGLELLSTDYINVHTDLEWKDSDGNTINLPFRKLQRRKLIKQSNTKGIDIEYCKAKGKEFGLELLSTEYVNVNTPLLWKDENGNEVELYLRQLQRSRKNDPKPKTSITVEFCREEGKKYGLELLSTDYKNVNEKLLWKKENGDELELSLRQIQRSKTGIF